jgi:hypothetical protein
VYEAGSQHSRFFTAIRCSPGYTVLCWLACSVHNGPPSPKFQILPGQLRQTADRAACLSIKSLCTQLLTVNIYCTLVWSVYIPTVFFFSKHWHGHSVHLSLFFYVVCLKLFVYSTRVLRWISFQSGTPPPPRWYL